MRKEFKLLILEIVLAIIVVLMFVCMFKLNIDLKFIKFIPIQNILEEYTKVTSATNNYKESTDKYFESLSQIDEDKNEYNIEKNKYLSVPDETLAMIKEATTIEKFDIEYMWVTLGNYAKRNNLGILLLEPGAVVESTDKKEDEKEDNNKDSGNINDIAKSKPEEGNEAKSNEAPANENKNNIVEDIKNNIILATNANEFKIKVTGSYIDLAEFVFNVENDKSLRFKLDKISMKLIEGTQVEANFVVKNLKFIK